MSTPAAAAAAAAAQASIDDLFRKSTLTQIHVTLKDTRHEVEAKKQELRELVGDHYRSVLESSEHIRSMFECAAKISSGSDRVEELITSMRTLAANPPPASASSAPVTSESPESDSEYRLGLQMTKLLEVPETMRRHLGAHQFVLAARAVLVDAAALQHEVDALLPRGGASASTPSSHGGFDFSALARQQTRTFRGLPAQVAASCADAFGAAALEPQAAAECFAVRLVLDSAAQPSTLLRTFVERRRELMRELMDPKISCGADGRSVSEGIGARLIAASLAYEGTVVLGGILSGRIGTSDTSPVVTALNAILQDAPERSKEEERAAIEGRAPSEDSTGITAAKRRADGLAASMRRGSRESTALIDEFAARGSELATEWSASAVGTNSDAAAGVSVLSARFARLIAARSVGGDASMASAIRSCASLGELLELGSEKVLSYRRALNGGSSASDSWNATWSASCGLFCPGQAVLEDSLSLLTVNIERACADVVCERVNELRLELVASADEEGDVFEAGAQVPAGTPAVGNASLTSIANASAASARRRDEIADLRQQSRLRILRFDDQLGEILADVRTLSRSGQIPHSVTAALIQALSQCLGKACEAISLPAATASATQQLWPLQRGAARAAVALDALLSAASGKDSESQGSTQTHLHAALQTALASGDAALASQAQGLLHIIRRSGESAYGCWARLAVTPEDGQTPFHNFWRLADDEVAPACGWGNAMFGQQATAPGGADSGSSSVKAVPVPVQASPFVSERLVLASQRSLEVTGNNGTNQPLALVAALKAALSEAFAVAFNDVETDLSKLKMRHLLQWLFDLRLLHIALSGIGSDSDGSAAYESLSSLREKVEAVALRDPVDKLLYHDVIKESVKNHIDGVKILWLPLFLHNPLYGYLSKPASGAASGIGGTGGSKDAFQLKADFNPPLRPVLPRFPLLPVAMNSSMTGGSELDVRLGLGPSTSVNASALPRGDSAGSVGAIAAAAGTGLASFASLGASMTSGFWGGDKPSRPPQAV